MVIFQIKFIIFGEHHKYILNYPIKTILTRTEGEGRESGMVLKTLLTGTEGELKESGMVLKTLKVVEWSGMVMKTI